MGSWLNNPGEPWGTPTGQTATKSTIFRGGGARQAGTMMIPPAIKLTLPTQYWSGISAGFVDAHPSYHRLSAGQTYADWIDQWLQPRILRNRLAHGDEIDGDERVAVYLEDDRQNGFPFALGYVYRGLPHGDAWQVWYGPDHTYTLDPDQLQLSHDPVMVFERVTTFYLMGRVQWPLTANTQELDPLVDEFEIVETEPLWNDRVPWPLGVEA